MTYAESVFNDACDGQSSDGTGAWILGALTTDSALPRARVGISVTHRMNQAPAACGLFVTALASGAGNQQFAGSFSYWKRGRKIEVGRGE